MRTVPVQKLNVKSWTAEATLELRHCVATTDWNELINTATDLDNAVEVVSAYICFCKDSVIQSKTVKLFANNKPWVTKELKLLLNEKRRVFHTGTKEDRKLVQKKLKRKIQECKKLYKVKVEDMFKANDTKRAWQGYKL